MWVGFKPTSDDFDEEVGQFTLDVDRSIEYLRAVFEEYGIGGDGALLEWLCALREVSRNECRHVIPEHFDDRARFLVAETLEKCPEWEVLCEACSKTFCARELLSIEWNESFVDDTGRRGGGSGFKIVCPNGHNLVFICTKIF